MQRPCSAHSAERHVRVELHLWLDAEDPLLLREGRGEGGGAEEALGRLRQPARRKAGHQDLVVHELCHLVEHLQHHLFRAWHRLESINKSYAHVEK